MSEGTVLASSTAAPSAFGMGERVFHIKFGYGHLFGIDSNTLIVQFDKAGENKMLGAFLERPGAAQGHRSTCRARPCTHLMTPRKAGKRLTDPPPLADKRG